jgi:hypothetical protein
MTLRNLILAATAALALSGCYRIVTVPAGGVYRVNVLTGSVKWCEYRYDKEHPDTSRVECD